MGIFVNNHDVPRFLHDNTDVKLFKSALAFSLVSRGIPFLYQGDEQGFNGAQDPLNREALWGHMNQTSELFLFIANLMRVRSVQETFNHIFYERLVTDNLYVFSRGKVLVALTNQV